MGLPFTRHQVEAAPALVAAVAPAAQLAPAGAPAAAPQLRSTPAAVPPNKFFLYVWGCSGSGKTLFARAVVLAAIANAGRTVIVDPNGVFAPEEGYGRVVTVKQAVAFLKGNPQGAFALIVRPGWSETLAPLWPQVFAVGRVTIVVDEVEDYIDDKGFMRLNQKGRNRWINMITTSQGPMSLPRRVRMNFDAIVCFRQPSIEYAELFAKDYLGDKSKAAPMLALPIERDPAGRLIRSRYIRVDASRNVTAGWLTP